MLRTGSEEWWQTLRGPQCRAVDDAIEVTFWWRDPAGDETCSPHRRVWLYITGVTDHHQNARPQSLQRLPGTTPGSGALRCRRPGAAATVLFPPTVTMIFPLRCSALMRPTARCYAKAGANCCRGR
ncbi:hypothetical protein CJ430_22305 [Klebsiella pneumoniae]|nr:hypothetical protein CJ430_22305 [Klebsiella pneumoniae]